MEIAVGDQHVLLTTHKTYREPDEMNGLQALSEFPAFQEFLARCGEQGPVPRAVVVRVLRRLAHRLTGALADVEYVDAAGEKLTQTIELTAFRPALLLPVAECGGERFGVLVRQRRAALAFAPSDEALDGVLSDDGGFTSDYDELLAELGVGAEHVVRAAEGVYTVGDEGGLPYTVFTTKDFRVDSAAALHERLAQLSEPLAVTLVAAPLAVVLSIGDTKARLAASLLLSS